MALSFIGYIIFFFFLLSALSLTTFTENLYRSFLILMFDTGAFSLVLIRPPRRSSFRMVGVCPLFVTNITLTRATSSVLYGYRVAKVSAICLVARQKKKMKYDGCEK